MHNDSTNTSIPLQWEVAKPYEGFTKAIETIVPSLNVLIIRQVNEMEKDLRRAKKLYES